MKVDLTADELFTIEMALDYVLYTLDKDFPDYSRYEQLDNKIGIFARQASREEGFPIPDRNSPPPQEEFDKEPRDDFSVGV